MDEIRHSPEHFLKEIEKEKQNLNRGHLKIFFGYAAGVGKTYAMLKAAHSVKRHGIDVVAGYIEPHARLQTSALVNGLECLPNLVSEYNGITLSEFNLDAALARHPQLILVDELAHTNAPVCRHTKRYQDIEELLNAGIDVYCKRAKFITRLKLSVQQRISLPLKILRRFGKFPCAAVPTG